jgi:hypothetical protein
VAAVDGERLLDHGLAADEHAKRPRIEPDQTSTLSKRIARYFGDHVQSAATRLR